MAAACTCVSSKIKSRDVLRTFGWELYTVTIVSGSLSFEPGSDTKHSHTHTFGNVQIILQHHALFQKVQDAWSSEAGHHSHIYHWLILPDSQRAHSSITRLRLLLFNGHGTDQEEPLKSEEQMMPVLQMLVRSVVVRSSLQGDRRWMRLSGEWRLLEWFIHHVSNEIYSTACLTFVSCLFGQCCSQFIQRVHPGRNEKSILNLQIVPTRRTLQQHPNTLLFSNISKAPAF